MKRCWSCQAFLSADNQTEDGLHCPNCGDEAPAADLRNNGWAWDDDQSVWVRGE